jgi:hypothetical protein
MYTRGALQGSGFLVSRRGALKDEAEKKNRSPDIGSARNRPARQAINGSRHTGRGQALLAFRQYPVRRTLRLTRHSADKRCPLFSFDVQLGDQSVYRSN